MTRQPNPKFYLGLTVGALVLGGGLAYWQSTVAADIESRVVKLRSDARNPDQLQREVDESNAEIYEVGSKLAHLERGVPEMAYVPTLLQELEQRGKANGIEVLGVRPIVTQAPPKSKDGEPKVRKPYTELDIEVRGRGNYAATLRFVQDLQAFPKILAARTVSMVPKQDFLDSSGSPLLDTTVQLRAYLFGSNLKPFDVNAKEKPTLSSHRREVSTYE